MAFWLARSKRTVVLVMLVVLAGQAVRYAITRWAPHGMQAVVGG